MFGCAVHYQFFFTLCRMPLIYCDVYGQSHTLSLIFMVAMMQKTKESNIAAGLEFRHGFPLS